MRKGHVKDRTDEELVDDFTSVGIDQFNALMGEDIEEFNCLYAEMDDIDKELRQRGPNARRALVRLYKHPNLQVRLKAAARTLAIAPEDARRVIEEIANSKSYPQAGDAGMTLYNLDMGIFVPS